MPEDVAEAFARLAQHRRVRRTLFALGDGLGLLDPQDEEPGGEEADRVGEHGVRRGEDLDGQAAEARAGELRRRVRPSSFEFPSTS